MIHQSIDYIPLFTTQGYEVWVLHGTPAKSVLEYPGVVPLRSPVRPLLGIPSDADELSSILDIFPLANQR